MIDRIIETAHKIKRHLDNPVMTLKETTFLFALAVLVALLVALLTRKP